MPHKQVLFGSTAREKILKGTAALAEAVRITLGPKSKSVLIQQKWGIYRDRASEDRFTIRQSVLPFAMTEPAGPRRA